VSYETLIRPLLFTLDPETAHHFSMSLLAAASRSSFALALLGRMAESDRPPSGPPIRLGPLEFKHPVGLAAGFDKDALALRAWEALGFSFVEAGTVTPRPQPGNPRPRIFRVPEDRALVNRLGFNNRGAAEIAGRLSRLRQAGRWPSIPVGINIGKNKDTPLQQATEDYIDCLEKLCTVADYFTLNVSSPNTPELRKLQDKDALDQLVSYFQDRNESLCSSHGIPRRPVFLKIAPDLSEAQLDDILEIAVGRKLDGMIATNTTIDKSSLSNPRWRGEEGGMSGKPLADRSTGIIKSISRKTEGKLPIIGVGGIFTHEDVQAKLDAGAKLVQVYTGFVYRGPRFVRELLGG
jgi:dihydroorotate dehydrogenase